MILKQGTEDPLTTYANLAIDGCHASRCSMGRIEQRAVEAKPRVERIGPIQSTEVRETVAMLPAMAQLRAVFPAHLKGAGQDPKVSLVAVCGSVIPHGRLRTGPSHSQPQWPSRLHLTRFNGLPQHPGFSASSHSSTCIVTVQSSCFKSTLSISSSFRLSRFRPSANQSTITPYAVKR